MAEPLVLFLVLPGWSLQPRLLNGDLTAAAAHKGVRRRTIRRPQRPYCIRGERQLTTAIGWSSASKTAAKGSDRQPSALRAHWPAHTSKTGRSRTRYAIAGNATRRTSGLHWGCVLGFGERPRTAPDHGDHEFREPDVLGGHVRTAGKRYLSSVGHLRSRRDSRGHTIDMVRDRHEVTPKGRERDLN
jgi:hypothetical protein